MSERAVGLTSIQSCLQDNQGGCQVHRYEYICWADAKISKRNIRLQAESSFYIWFCLRCICALRSSGIEDRALFGPKKSSVACKDLEVSGCYSENIREKVKTFKGNLIILTLLVYIPRSI